jgi:alpha-beta hydrolase superfamily lysophospholipase
VRSRNDQLTSSDGRTFHYYQWAADVPPRAIVQIVHGAAEHAGRYAPFAEALVARGWAVVAEDHRGHGRTIAVGATPGDMGPANAIERVADDVLQLAQHAQAQYPGIPVVLFGHSMGSLISQRVLARRGALYAAAVLSGSLAVDLVAQAKPAIDEAVRRQGRDAPAAELQSAMFGALMQGFKDPRTPFDWLSRDAAEVDKYINDPLCGFPLSNGAWQDIAESALRTLDADESKKIPAALPVLILSGTDDPVHLNGLAIQQLHDRLRGAGVTRLTRRLYPGGRHEMLNELNRDEVVSETIAWIDSILPKGA